MLFLAYLSFSLFWIQGTRGQVILTQSPSSLFLSVGDPATLKCQSDSDIDDDINWYKQNQNTPPPKLLFYEGNNRNTGVPDRFNINGYGKDFTLTISTIEAEDEGYYYCQQSDRYPYTFGGGTKVEINRGKDASPSAVIYPPSEEQLKTSSVTIVCLVDGFYPGELNVEWKMDGTIITEGAQTSSAAQNADKTYRLSSMLSLPKETYNSHELYVCEVKHKTLAQPLVKSFKRSECS